MKLLSITTILLVCLVACDSVAADAPQADSEDIVCELSFLPETSERIVIDAVNRAQETIDIALYGFDNDRICDALIEAAQRGVVIRCCAEYDSEEEESWSRLIRESRENSAVSINVKVGNHSGIMHNKYFIVDGVYVITGSTNLTEGMQVHFNNLILIKSASLAEEYQRDFDVMYAGYFSSAKGGLKRSGYQELYNKEKWPEKTHRVGRYSIQAFFTPYTHTYSAYCADNPVEYVYYDYESGCTVSTADTPVGNYNNAMNVIFPLLQDAQETICIYSFAFTDKVLIDLLMQAHDRGVTVKVWMDYMMYRSGMSHSGKSIIALAQKIGDLRICRHPDGGLLHHKVILIDGSIVVLGSLNFSSNAVSNNDENFIVIRNADPLHDAFMEEAARINTFAHPLRIKEDEYENLEPLETGRDGNIPDTANITSGAGVHNGE